MVLATILGGQTHDRLTESGFGDQVVELAPGIVDDADSERWAHGCQT